MVEQPRSFRSEPPLSQGENGNLKNDCSSVTDNGSDLSNAPVFSISSPSVSSTVHDTTEQECDSSVSQPLVGKIKEEGGGDMLSPSTSSTDSNSSSRPAQSDVNMRSIHGSSSSDPIPTFNQTREPPLQQSLQQVYLSDINSPGTSSNSSSRPTESDVHPRSICGSSPNDPLPTFKPPLERSPQQVYLSDIHSPGTSSNSSSRPTQSGVLTTSIHGSSSKDPTLTLNQTRKQPLKRSSQQVYLHDINSPGTSSNSSFRPTESDVHPRSICGSSPSDPLPTFKPPLERSPQKIYLSDINSPSTSFNSCSRPAKGDFMRLIYGSSPSDPTPTFNQTREPPLQPSSQQVYLSDINAPSTTSNSRTRLTQGDYMRLFYRSLLSDPIPKFNQTRKPPLQRPPQQIYVSDINAPSTSSNPRTRLTHGDYMRLIYGSSPSDPTVTFNQTKEPPLQRSSQQVYLSDINSPSTSSNSRSRPATGDFMRLIYGSSPSDPTPTFNQTREPPLQRSPQQVYLSDMNSPSTSSNSSSRPTESDVCTRSIHGSSSRDHSPRFNEVSELPQAPSVNHVHWDFLRLRYELGPNELLLNTPTPQYWCTITYFELDEQVGDPFKVSSNIHSVIIDGYMDPLTLNRFCLGAISNVNRTQETELARMLIGKGVRLDLVGGGDVWLKSLNEKCVFVRSHYLDEIVGTPRGSAVHQVYPSAYVKVFDLTHYLTQIKNQIEAGSATQQTQASVVIGYTQGPYGEGEIISGINNRSDSYIGVDDLRKPCMLQISLVKGWGPDHPRSSIKQTPCWVEIHLHRALQLLDALIHSQSHRHRRRE